MKIHRIRWKRPEDKTWQSELGMSYGMKGEKLTWTQDFYTIFNLTILNLVICVGSQVGFLVERFKGTTLEVCMPWSCLVLPSVTLFLVFGIMCWASVCCGDGGKISLLMTIAFIMLSCSILSLGITLDMFWPLPVGCFVSGGLLLSSICLFVYCIVLYNRSSLSNID